MSSAKRTSAAGIRARLLRGLGVAALVAIAGCSADVTRFSLLGGYAPPTPTPAAYAPTGRGYGTGASGNGFGLQESALAPLKQPEDYRAAGRDYPPVPAGYVPPGRSEGSPKAPDRGGPLWTDRDPPPWTDRDPFPWPAAPSAKGAPHGGPAGWQGRYTMQRGDTLAAIAQRHKVSVDELKRANDITDTTRLFAGKVLAVPASAGKAPAASVAPRVVQVTPRIVGAPQAAPAAEPEQEPAPKAQRTARNDATATDAMPQPAVAAGKFRWPARGKIIAGFGAQPDGSRNEGINLAVPLGTEIHAAEAGRVHYAGDGLKGYGNLILIRHPNGWTSTYAHADQMLVKVGDEVKRGQVIGKAGKSGPVAQPQLRFELRKGSVPVDPVPYLVN